jgi:hypothetical protein
MLENLYYVKKPDSNFFESVGLPRHDNAKLPHAQDYLLGTVEIEGGSVNVWVCAMPAQFWKFEITPFDSDKLIVLSTGSGNLATYWPTVRLFAGGMIGIKKQ